MSTRASAALPEHGEEDISSMLPIFDRVKHGRRTASPLLWFIEIGRCPDMPRFAKDLRVWLKTG